MAAVNVLLCFGVAVTPVRRHSESSSRRYDEQELEDVMREIHDSFPPEPSKSESVFSEPNLRETKQIHHCRWEVEQAAQGAVCAAVNSIPGRSFGNLL